MEHDRARGRAGVRVVVRVRPPHAGEVSSTAKIRVDGQDRVLAPSREDGSSRCFELEAFGQDVSQEHLFEEIARPLVPNLFSWYNSTLFAYGQTGSGKTHSMSWGGREGDPMEKGIIPRLVEDLFARVEAHNASEATCLSVLCSYVELYQERFLDLLGPNEAPLRVRKDPELGLYVDGATRTLVQSVEACRALVADGDRRRKVAAHDMNARSSRSHSVLTLTLQESVEVGEGRTIACRHAKLCLCDLAGSERQKDTKAQGLRLSESSHINRGLLTLQRVITALAARSSSAGSSSIAPPYRESKLTHLLEDGLSGTALCTMLCCVSPADASVSQSLSTLKYASSASSIRHFHAVERNRELPEVEGLREEVAALRARLEENGEGGRGGGGGGAGGLAAEKIAQLEAAVSRANAARARERAAFELGLPPPLRAVARLRTCGVRGSESEADRLGKLERQMQEGLAQLNHQRKRVKGMEASVNETIREFRKPRGLDSPPPPEEEQQMLERLLAQLTTTHAETQRLRAARDAARSLHNQMEQAVRDALANVSPEDAGGGDDGEGAKVEDEADEEEEEEEEAMDKVSALEPIAAARAALKSLLIHLHERAAGMCEAAAADDGDGEEGIHVETSERIDVEALLELVARLPASDNADEEVEEQLVLGGRALADRCDSARHRHRNAGAMFGSAKLAEGDTRALNFLTVSISEIDGAVRRLRSRHEKAVSELLEELGGMRRAVFEASQEQSLAAGELAEALAELEDARHAAECARMESSRLTTVLAETQRECAERSELEEAAKEKEVTHAQEIQSLRAELEASAKEKEVTHAQEIQSLRAELEASAKEKEVTHAQEIQSLRAELEASAKEKAALEREVLMLKARGEARDDTSASAALAAARATVDELSTHLRGRAEAVEALAEERGLRKAGEKEREGLEARAKDEEERRRKLETDLAVSQARLDILQQQQSTHEPQSRACAIM